MRKIIIFGAMATGMRAANYYGLEQVECFVDNAPQKEGTIFCGKEIISFAGLLSLYRKEKHKIIIASLYYKEIAAQLEESQITEYSYFAFDFNFLDQEAFSIADLLNHPYLLQCASFCLYGINDATECLLEQIEKSPVLKSKLYGVIDSEGRYKEAGFCGTSIKSKKDCMNTVELFIITTPRNMDTIREEVTEAAIKFVLDLYQVEVLQKKDYLPELCTYKDAYKKKRCFIIGNGPSLKIEDLEVLKQNNVYCFGSNKIYYAFDQTDWRPDTYCVMDLYVFEQDAEIIAGLDIKNKFVSDWAYHFSGEKEVPGAYLFHAINQHFLPYSPGFSHDITKGIYEGGTVTYTMLQIAMYMGFSEIYLLGVDFTGYATSCSEGIETTGAHFYKEQLSSEGTSLDQQVYTRNAERMSLVAFQQAEAYAKKHSVKIINATRGGILEVFERKQFDSLF